MALTADKIKYIVIHCSATLENSSYGVEQLRRDHIRRGFREIGYHFYITRDGHLHKTRSIDIVGAHALGYNHCSIGVCYEGGLTADGRAQDTRTWAQRETLSRLIRTLRPYYSQAEVVGHRDLSPDLNQDGKISSYEWIKMCPCFDARAEYSRV